MPVFHLLDKAPEPVAPYSHAVEVDGWVLLAGQIPAHPDDGHVSRSIESQSL